VFCVVFLGILFLGRWSPFFFCARFCCIVPARIVEFLTVGGCLKAFWREGVGGMSSVWVWCRRLGILVVVVFVQLYTQVGGREREGEVCSVTDG
jgi:hypothetical protein